MVTYQVLGPVTVLGDSGALALGGNNQRTLLAVLLASRNRVVTVSALADALWPARLPVSESHAVHTVVSRTRRALGTHRDDIVTTPEGYRLATSTCDAVAWEESVFESKTVPPKKALEILQQALGLWRGPAYGSHAELESVRTEAIRLDQQRLNVTEDRFQLLLDLGQFPEAIPGLEAFVAAEPMRERARALLMQALYWTNRQSDALAVYADYRTLMGDGLGLEPSAQLKALEESIILDDLDLPVPATTTGARLFGRLGKEIGTGPGAAELEQQGWDLLWHHDHEGSVEARQKAYVRLLQEGDRPGAARVAIWLGVNAAIRLKNSVAFGWLRRAHQLLEGQPTDPAHGLLAGLVGMVEVLSGDLASALEHGTRAQQIGVESGDLEVEALGKAIRGWAQVRLGNARPGLALMDEAMASAVSGELGEYVSALVYCRTLCACLDLMDYQRASEWTDEIARVRDSGGMSDLPGDCRTHRVAILLMRGDWAEGEREALVACSETEAFDLTHLAVARALRGEILLRRGDISGAESELTAAQQMGASPHPGLALVQLARGDAQGAAEMIAHAVSESSHDPLQRARLLPALVEIALARGEVTAAREAADDLTSVASQFRTSALLAYAKHAVGSVELAAGDPGAVRTLRDAVRRWSEVGSTYRAAAARLVLAEALSAAGRRQDAVIEAGAARDVLVELGATPDVRSADDLLSALT